MIPNMLLEALQMKKFLQPPTLLPRFLKQRKSQYSESLELMHGDRTHTHTETHEKVFPLLSLEALYRRGKAEWKSHHIREWILSETKKKISTVFISFLILTG